MSTKMVKVEVEREVHSCETCGISQQIIDGRVTDNPSNSIYRCSVCGADMCNDCLIKKGACEDAEDTPILCPSCVAKGLRIKSGRDDDHIGYWVVGKDKKEVDTPYW